MKRTVSFIDSRETLKAETVVRKQAVRYRAGLSSKRDKPRGNMNQRLAFSCKQ